MKHTFFIIKITILIILGACSELTEYENPPPRISSISAARDTVLVGSTVELNCVVKKQNSNLDYQWQCVDGIFSGNGSVVYWKSPDSSGVYLITCFVSDEFENVSSDSVTIIVVSRQNSILYLKPEPQRLPVLQKSLITCYLDQELYENTVFQWKSEYGFITGSGASVIFNAPDSADTFRIMCYIGNPGGINDSAFTDIEIFRNSRPKILALTVNTSELLYGDKTILKCNARDNNGDKLFYTWETNAGELESYDASAIYTAPSLTGYFEIKCTVTDEYGAYDSTSVLINVKENNLPQISKISAYPPELEAGETSVLSCTAFDPDGKPLEYSWNAAFGTIDGLGSTVTWTAPDQKGQYRIDCTVTDERGGQDFGSVNITVLSGGSDTTEVFREQFNLIGEWDLYAEEPQPGSNSEAKALIEDGQLLLYANRDQECISASANRELRNAAPVDHFIMDLFINEIMYDPNYHSGSGLSMVLKYDKFELTIYETALVNTIPDPVLLRFVYDDGNYSLIIGDGIISEQFYNLRISSTTNSFFDFRVISCSDEPDAILFRLEEIMIRKITEP